MMKTNFIINLILFNLLSSVIAFNDYSSNSSPNLAFINDLNEWEEIPLSNGTWVWAHKSQIEFEVKEFAAKQSDALANITFKLFTKLNPTNGQQIFLNDKNSIEKSNFNPEYPTRFIVHGWLNNETSHINHLLRNAYLQRNEFFNIIIMDWGSIAMDSSYNKARSSIISVGKLLSSFIDFLHVDGKLSFKTLYLSGYSLGAHICGIAGKNVNKGKINAIVGLDPAGPLFSYNAISERIHKTDAEYVEVIHTDMKRYGFKHPIGKASFSPNGGFKQPGCGYFQDIFGCSHARAYQFFAESIVNNTFLPHYCVGFDDTENKCMSTIKRYKMGGEPLDHGKNAIYYVSTNERPPFGQGYF